MNNALLDILQAWGAISGPMSEIAMMIPVYAMTWTLAWIASERCALPQASATQVRR
jgi:hypothetical protein